MNESVFHLVLCQLWLATFANQLIKVAVGNLVKVIPVSVLLADDDMSAFRGNTARTAACS